MILINISSKLLKEPVPIKRILQNLNSVFLLYRPFSAPAACQALLVLQIFWPGFCVGGRTPKPCQAHFVFIFWPGVTVCVGDKAAKVYCTFSVVIFWPTVCVGWKNTKKVQATFFFNFLPQKSVSKACWAFSVALSDPAGWLCGGKNTKSFFFLQFFDPAGWLCGGNGCVPGAGGLSKKMKKKYVEKQVKKTLKKNRRLYGGNGCVPGAGGLSILPRIYHNLPNTNITE